MFQALPDLSTEARASTFHPRTLEMLAVKMLETGRTGRALAHHARAMALYPEPYFRKVAALLRKAGMGIVSDPHTGPLHARVKELLQNGNLVCLGQDDCCDRSEMAIGFGRHAGRPVWVSGRRVIGR